jgi:cytochrome d ubiquinol oxidase subunit II
LPNAIGLLPIPLSCLLLYGGLLWLLRKPRFLQRGYAWLVFASLVMIAIMAAVGLAFSIYPDIIIGQITIWEAASATDSLLIIFYGVCISLPAIIAYTVYVYWIFHGKTAGLSYE